MFTGVPYCKKLCLNFINIILNVISACLHSRMVQLLHQTVFQVAASLFCLSVCCICGKILYPPSEYWLADIPLHEQRAGKIISDPSQVSIAYREKQMSNDNIKQ